MIEDCLCSHFYGNNLKSMWTLPSVVIVSLISRLVWLLTVEFKSRSLFLTSQITQFAGMPLTASAYAEYWELHGAITAQTQYGKRHQSLLTPNCLATWPDQTRLWSLPSSSRTHLPTGHAQEEDREPGGPTSWSTTYTTWDSTLHQAGTWPRIQRCGDTNVQALCS